MAGFILLVIVVSDDEQHGKFKGNASLLLVLISQQD